MLGIFGVMLLVAFAMICYLKQEVCFEGPSATSPRTSRRRSFQLLQSRSLAKLSVQEQLELLESLLFGLVASTAQNMSAET